MYPPPIDHRCMEYCYTKKVSQIAEYKEGALVHVYSAICETFLV